MIKPFCVLNKADQFYSTLEYAKAVRQHPSFDTGPFLNKVVLKYLKQNPYGTLLEFLRDTSINADTGEIK